MTHYPAAPPAGCAFELPGKGENQKTARTGPGEIALAPHQFAATYCEITIDELLETDILLFGTNGIVNTKGYVTLTWTMYPGLLQVDPEPHKLHELIVPSVFLTGE